MFAGASAAGANWIGRGAADFADGNGFARGLRFPNAFLSRGFTRPHASANNVRMTRLTVYLSLLLAATAAYADGLSLEAESVVPLPIPISNNAVVTVSNGERQFVISFAGLGNGRGHDDVLAKTFIHEPGGTAWREAAPLPPGEGRLAATAVGSGGLAYVFGGYTVAADGSEASTPWVHAFDPETGKYTRRQDMPVPVDDTVAIGYEDRYIFLISGWHDLGNVNLTQRYDTHTDSWVQATPLPGRAVFGHAGGIVGGRIIFCDGVSVRPYANRPRDFVTSGACFAGTIDAEDSRRIDWRVIDSHPGRPRYRMAAAGLAARNAVLFIGGSENPYNYDGIGYDGEPSEPVADALLYDLTSNTWREISGRAPATMDHRGLVRAGDRWLVVGGMLAKQNVTARVTAYSLR